MFESYFKKNEVINFFKDIVVPDTRFSKKNIPYRINGERVDYYSYDLLMGMDAILKYIIILEEDTYFYEYLEQVTKLLKKVENHNDIKIGINKLIVNACRKKLGLKEENDNNNEKIIYYIYDKYIVNGYFFYSFPSKFLDNILRDGLSITDF